MVISFGLKSAHEQYTPNQLIDQAVLAEKAGFDSLWASDHFLPWAHTNAQSGFTWVWMASTAERTRRARIGTAVTAPTFRYHPALVAQAFATLGHIYPGRIRLGLGSGEAMNEVPLGYDWPRTSERMERLEEAVKVIRMLWDGDFVTYNGKYYRLRNAKLYTKSDQPVPIYIAGAGPKIAYIAGKYADGFYTALVIPIEEFKSKVLPAVRKGREEAGKSYEGMPASIELLFSYDEDLGKALDSMKFWTGGMLSRSHKYDISDPRELEERGRMLGDEEILKRRLVTSDLERIVERADACYSAGFSEVVFHSSSPDQNKVINLLGSRVIPYLRDKYAERK